MRRADQCRARPICGQVEVSRQSIKEVLSQEDTEDGWVNLGTVGKQLLNLTPDFDPRTFGFRKLSDLIRKTNQFEIRQAEGGPVSIRVKRGGKK